MFSFSLQVSESKKKIIAMYGFFFNALFPVRVLVILFYYFFLFFATDYLFCITFQIIFLFEFGSHHMFYLGLVHRTIDNMQWQQWKNKVSNEIRQCFQIHIERTIAMKLKFEYHSMMRRTMILLHFVEAYLENRHWCILHNTPEGDEHCLRHVFWPVNFKCDLSLAI